MTRLAGFLDGLVAALIAIPMLAAVLLVIVLSTPAGWMGMFLFWLMFWR